MALTRHSLRQTSRFPPIGRSNVASVGHVELGQECTSQGQFVAILRAGEEFNDHWGSDCIGPVEPGQILCPLLSIGWSGPF